MTTVLSTERIHADHRTVKHLGHWTSAGRFEVRARSAAVVLDLRSPQLPAELELHLDLHRSLVKLLLPENARIDQWDLAWPAKGRLKDGQAPADGADGPLVRLLGTAADSELRVHRGGVAQLSAMCSRAYLDDLRRAHREGTLPTVDDPTRTA
ncbi:hypothetical protein ACFW1A_15825 [Kitasatospora sp. NPDC058965]|uniref:hypothetical protein n=1 Tax=Kitasatospora sp. NPDC058965 TaxID=3346682 RepID=UPI0036AE4304